jgi:hypothetical protein
MRLTPPLLPLTKGRDARIPPLKLREGVKKDETLKGKINRDRQDEQDERLII